MSSVIYSVLLRVDLRVAKLRVRVLLCGAWRVARQCSSQRALPVHEREILICICTLQFQFDDPPVFYCAFVFVWCVVLVLVLVACAPGSSTCWFLGGVHGGG